MSKPGTVPTWDSNATNITTPPAGVQTDGQVNGTQLPAARLNFMFYWLYKWAAYLNDTATLAADIAVSIVSVAMTWTAAHIFSAAATFNAAVSFTSTVSSTNAITAPNTAKAFGRLFCTGSGTVTVVGGSNIASATITSSEVAVTFTTPMNSSNYTVALTKIAAPTVEVAYFPVESITGKTTSGFRIQGLNGSSPVSLDNAQIRMQIAVFDV